MSFTDKITIGWAGDSGTALSKLMSLTADANEARSVSIADSTTDGVIDLTLDVSDLVFFLLVANGTITIETNDGTTPDDTFALTSGVPVLWYAGCGSAIGDIFSADITALYATNASGAAVTVDIRLLKDSTP